jgi:hypothetical protein
LLATAPIASIAAVAASGGPLWPTKPGVQLVTFDASGEMSVLGSAITVTGSQQGHAELTFPTGVAVRPGSAICAVGPPRTTAVEITGYFAKDR